MEAGGRAGVCSQLRKCREQPILQARLCGTPQPLCGREAAARVTGSASFGWGTSKPPGLSLKPLFSPSFKLFQNPSVTFELSLDRRN